MCKEMVLFICQLCFVLTAQKTKVQFYVVPRGAFFTSFLSCWVSPEAGGWRWSCKLLCGGGTLPGLSVGMASCAVCCAPGLASGGISQQLRVSAEMVGAQGTVCCLLLVIYRCFHLTHGSFTGPFYKNLKWCKTGGKEKGKILVYVKK